MKPFTLYDKNTAPNDSKPLIENSIKAFGMLPNLHAVMAESPQLLEGYQQLHQLFLDSSFDATEKTVVWQTINRFHSCHYCVPAHTAIAHSMKVDKAVIDAVYDGTALPDPKLQVLADTTLAMVKDRGVISPEQAQAFYDAGFTQQNLLELVLAVAQKVMSNFTNHLAETPLDEPFKPFVK